MLQIYIIMGNIGRVVQYLQFTNTIEQWRVCNISVANDAKQYFQEIFKSELKKN